MLAVIVGWVSVALAAPDLLVSVEVSGVEDRFRAAAGVVGDGAIAACRSLAPDLSACLRVKEGDRRRMVSLADLGGWGLTEADAWSRALSVVNARWDAHPAKAQTVDGMEGRYFLRSEADGSDCAGMLLRRRLADLAGGAPVVACPVEGAALFWIPSLGGSSDFDKVVSVGVRRLYEGEGRALSPRVYTWDGDKLVVWGEVRGNIDDLAKPTPPDKGSGGPPLR